MSLRLRRLANEETMLREHFSGNPHVTVRPVGGDPPDRYRVEYRIGGLERRVDGSLVVRRSHEMEIVLPAEYPRQPAACRMLSPVFHPNIDSFTVCTSDFHAAQETLCDLIVRVGQMIAFQRHNVKSPLNAEAANWCEQNLARLPVDRVDFQHGSVGDSAAHARAAVPTSPSPPDCQREPVSDQVDTVEVVRISSRDPSVTRESAVASVGTSIQLGAARLLIALQADPPRIAVCNMAGNEVINIPFAATWVTALGGTSIRITGIDQTSIARLGTDQATWSPGNPDVTRFWNGVLQTQATLALRAQRVVETTVHSNPAFQRVQTLARSKVERNGWLLAHAPAGAKAKIALGDANRRLWESMKRVGGAS